MITTNKLDALKNAYAEMIVEGMDMNSLITLAVESIEQNLKDYDMDDLREEVCDCYGEETWTDMISWVTVHYGLHHPPIDAILITTATNPMDYDTETLWNEINDMPGEIHDIIDEEEEDGFSVLDFQEALKGDNDF